jgi:predicted DNA-binding protein
MAPRKRTAPARPYGQDKKHRAFRFTDDFSRRLKKAAKKTKMTETAYLEQAAETQFKKDDIE